MRGATFWGRVDPRSVELHSMVSVGPSALSCVVPLRNIGLLAPNPPSTISKATRRGLNIDSIAALIVVKQLWRKRNFVPERLGDPGGDGPRSSTSQEKGAGPGSPIFSVFVATSANSCRDTHYRRTSTETRGSTSEQVRSYHHGGSLSTRLKCQVSNLRKHVGAEPLEGTAPAFSRVPGLNARPLALCRHVGASPMAGVAYRIQQSARLSARPLALCNM